MPYVSAMKKKQPKFHHKEITEHLKDYDSGTAERQLNKVRPGQLT